MKNILAVITISLISTSTLAQSSNWFEAGKPVLCGPIKEFIGSLTQDFKEYPVFIGKDGKEESRYSLFVNQETGTWTIIQFGREIACLLGVGAESKLIVNGKPTL